MTECFLSPQSSLILRTFHFRRHCAEKEVDFSFVEVHEENVLKPSYITLQVLQSSSAYQHILGFIYAVVVGVPEIDKGVASFLLGTERNLIYPRCS